MKIVLDTNCLIPILVPGSYGYDIWQAFRQGRYTLCVSTEILSPSYRFNLIKADPDDNKFVDCAVTAGATYIVSNDRHFRELQQYDFPKVDVRTLTEFLNIVRTL